MKTTEGVWGVRQGHWAVYWDHRLSHREIQHQAKRYRKTEWQDAVVFALTLANDSRNFSIALKWRDDKNLTTRRAMRPAATL